MASFLNSLLSHSAGVGEVEGIRVETAVQESDAPHTDPTPRKSTEVAAERAAAQSFKDRGETSKELMGPAYGALQQNAREMQELIDRIIDNE